ncbi:LacI family DNA-binding transcriptional regulator [Acidisoma sp. S159]|jgi:DNA-binding LacI/PurR family transcriptional regulator|uniref:LacI family DNA-binding transcriptional regulator n=1 Tax=Acidisoma sp. S159 TaxID=1747225 RepID=UPI00131DAA42|nr:LacI family DNA-binding transcriptional regulator [Acidisoma sp. S159]
MKDESAGSQSRRVASKRYVSATDVARKAGVSQAAVSRAFTDGASVSLKMRAKVMVAADELGYRPSIIPRIMLTNRSSLIAVVSSGLNHPFYAAIVDRFSVEIQKRGNTVLLFSVQDREYMDEIIPRIRGYQVDGIISASSISSPAVAESCAKMNVPVVLFNSRLRNTWVNSVNSDNVAGGRDVASLFIRKGATRFGFIAGRKGNMSSEDRLAGFVGRLVEEGISDLVIEYGNYSFEGGSQAMRKLLARDRRPNAIFCANDLMAIGALEIARSEFKIDVPASLLIAGFDDIPSASWPSINLTSIRPNGDRMVSEALDILEGSLSSPGEGGLLKIVPVHIIERLSTAGLSER